MKAHLDVSVSSAAQASIDAVVKQATTAEELGYRRVWLPETWGRNAAVMLAAIAERTDDIGLGTSIMPVYSRSPTLVGQTAATLQELSDGRFRLGLGSSGPAVIENWHGVGFDRPLRRTRESVDVVRKVLAGEVVDYDGDLFSLSGFRLRSNPPAVAPPVDVAGIGPKAVELAGRFADGWHAIFLTPDGVRERMDDLERGASMGDTDLADHETLVKIPCCALADGEEARRLSRRHLGFYIGAMGAFYRDALVRQGYEVAIEIHDLWQSGDHAAATEAIDDDLLDSVAAAGTPERARETIERFAAVPGVDVVAITFPREATQDVVLDTIRAVAPRP